MTRQLYVFPISLTIEAPVLIAGGHAAQFGIDVLHVRNPDGWPIIPDTEFKGLLRAAWVALKDEGVIGPIDIDAAFGARSADTFGAELNADFGLAERRGSLIFRDLVANVNPVPGRHKVTRVKINDATGAAEEAALLTEELIAPHGAQVTYAGDLLALVSQAELEPLRAHIEAALKMIYAVGKSKSAGYGRLMDVNVGPGQSHSKDALQVPHGAAYHLTFELDSALLVDIERPDANTLVGRSIIPGGVIKGALAQRLIDCGEDPSAGDLAKALSEMVISHAVPDGVAGATATRLDIVQLSEAKKGDQAEAGCWSRLNDVEMSSRGWIWAFQPDFKDYTPDEKGNPLVRDARTRVEIGADGTAQDGVLFAQSAIHPSLPNADKIKWQAKIVWPGEVVGPEYEALVGTMEALSQGLYRIGKRASCTENSAICLTPAAEIAPLEDGQIIDLVLTSPALMVRAAHLEDEEKLSGALNHYFQTISGESVKIATDRISLPGDEMLGGSDELDYYCQFETRTGFQALQFSSWGGTHIEPFVLVSPGSVFRLEILDASAATEHLRDWLNIGLPEANWQDAGDLGKLRLQMAPSTLTYRNCPFVRQNGYGQVTLGPQAQEGTA